LYREFRNKKMKTAFVYAESPERIAISGNFTIITWQDTSITQQGQNTIVKSVYTDQSGDSGIMTLPLAYADGPKPFDIPLNGYTGRRAYLILEVDAGSTVGQDWTLWQDVKIWR
jgi:hypothetical protein